MDEKINSTDERHKKGRKALEKKLKGKKKEILEWKRRWGSNICTAESITNRLSQAKEEISGSGGQGHRTITPKCEQKQKTKKQNK